MINTIKAAANHYGSSVYDTLRVNRDSYRLQYECDLEADLEAQKATIRHYQTVFQYRHLLTPQNESDGAPSLREGLEGKI